jgi:hypothetical protein
MGKRRHRMEMSKAGYAREEKAQFAGPYIVASEPGR